MDYIKEYASPLGKITLASDGEAITGLWFSGQKHFGATLPDAYEEKELPVLIQAAKWLDIYFGGNAPDFTPPVRLRGTPFQTAVWEQLTRIPYGKTATYGELAKALERRLGRKTAARAVGGAVARNPVSLIVPCHRVIGADGSLTGYAGGVDRKRVLLETERKSEQFGMRNSECGMITE